jgi:enamine deaminase RidA (YjgF/YER057c/UK114 family)
MAVTPLLPVELGRGKIRFARGMKAGRWVFASGCMAQDFTSGIDPAVLSLSTPHSGLPKREKEAALIFDHMARVLDEAGTDLHNIVRTDQYYTGVDVVPSYQGVRRQRLGQDIPPSTSIAMKGFVLPDADMNVQAIAVIPEDGFQPEHLRHRTIQSRPTSGYSPALTVDDFVFLPGSTSMSMADEPAINNVAAAARMSPGMQWGGEPIKLETEFIINERLAPSLELAGSTLKDAVKAQVYLTDPKDYSAFNEVWVRHFGESGPALTVIPCIDRGLAVIDGKIEINLLALKSGGTTKKEQIRGGVTPGFRCQPQAVRAGDLLFLSGLMAIDENGLVEEAKTDPGQPYFGSTANAEARCIIDHASALCEAAGTSISNTVRIQQFHTDISDFYPVYQAWETALDGQPIPFSAVEVPGPLPVPSATLLMDIWVYCP